MGAAAVDDPVSVLWGSLTLLGMAAFGLATVTKDRWNPMAVGLRVFCWVAAVTMFLVAASAAVLAVVNGW